MKGADGAEPVRGVRTVASGEVILSGEIANGMLDRLRGDVPAERAFPDLSDREREILQLMARGHSNTAIAERVFLTHKTVRNSVTSIFRKPGVEDRVEAVIRAREAGL